MYVTRLSWSESLTSEWEDGFQLEEKWGSLVHSSETNEGIRAGGLGCMVMTGRKGLASTLGNTLQHSRQKCMPSRSVQWRIQMRDIRTETSVFCLKVKL
jgi:hypothetical protein